MADSAEAKQRLFKKEKVFTEPEERWVTRFIMTARRSPRERVFMQHVRGILIHLQAPRSVMNRLGDGKIPVAGGAYQPRGETLGQEALLSRVLRLMHEAPRAFPSNPGLVVKLRKLGQHLGAGREELR
jgi:hypothetical protein